MLMTLSYRSGPDTPAAPQTSCSTQLPQSTLQVPFTEPSPPPTCGATDLTWKAHLQADYALHVHHSPCGPSPQTMAAASKRVSLPLL